MLRARVGYWYCSARVARQTKRALARTVDGRGRVSVERGVYCPPASASRILANKASPCGGRPR